MNELVLSEVVVNMILIGSSFLAGFGAGMYAVKKKMEKMSENLLGELAGQD